MKGLVSVIIPVYNRQTVVGECVQSVLAQGYPNFEIIMVDDGSVDDSLKICRNLAQTDSRILVLAMEHGGVSAARNMALEAAKGEYVFFVDSDDVIHPGLLDALVRGMDRTGAAIGGTDVIGVSESNWYRVKRKITEEYQPGETKFYSHEETLREIFCNRCPLSMIGGVMIRRDWIGESKFRTDLFIGEDFFFIYENLIKGTGAVFTDQKWYYSRHHAGNTSWNYGFEGFRTRFLRRKLVWESEESYGRTEYADRQKRQAFGMYLMCMERNPAGSPESKRMRIVVRQHRKVLFPSFSWKDKVKYFLSVYLPTAYIALRKIKKVLKK